MHISTHGLIWHASLQKEFKHIEEISFFVILYNLDFVSGIIVMNKNTF